MDLARLQLAARLGGTLLQAPGAPPLVLVERTARHGAPLVLVLAASPDLLEPVLAAWAQVQGEGLDLNLAGLLDPGPGRAAALAAHARRIGALVCALEAWPGPPVLARRLPGRLRAARPLALEPVRLGPLERARLRDFHPDLDPEALRARFEAPVWARAGDAWEAPHWPGVPVPAEAEVVQAGLDLETATPLADALRAALRAGSGGPVPVLPLERDPGPLEALAVLGAGVQGFPGEGAAWVRALRGLAALPAPPHFCARC